MVERVVRELEPEFDVIASVANGQAAVEAGARLAPDVLVLDISMPVLDGLQAARKIRTSGSDVPIVFLTVHEDSDFAEAAFAAGAQGYVVKSRFATDLVHAVREALAGRRFVSPLHSS